MNNYRILLAECTPTGDDAETADSILAAKMPHLCPDCKGSGFMKKRILGGVVDDWDCDHLNAPTIADLLRWGENVAKCADPYDGQDKRTVVHPDLEDFETGYAATLLAVLRTKTDK